MELKNYFHKAFHQTLQLPCLLLMIVIILDYRKDSKKSDYILDIMLRCHIFFNSQNTFLNDFQGEIHGHESRLPKYC